MYNTIIVMLKDLMFKLTIIRLSIIDFIIAIENYNNSGNPLYSFSACFSCQSFKNSATT